MGLGAAFVMPSTLSILANVFPPQERTKAIAIWAGISGAGAALGPIASGFLLEHFSWGAVFFVNVPIILVALVAGWFLVPRSSDPEHARLDPVGALLSIAGLSALVYSIIEAPHHGWASVTTFAWFTAALVLIGGFIAWELHSSHPMLDLHWFRDRRFSVASGGITLVFFAMFGTFFLITQYFQLVLGYTALEAGIKQLPVAAMMILVAPQTPRFSARFGANRVTGVGLGFVGAGLLVLGMLGASTPYVVVVIPMLMISGGMALTIAPFTGSIMSAVPPARAGVGSAMNDTTRELGGALGVAVLGSLVLSQYQSAIDPALAGLPEAARAMADSGLAGALQVAAGLEPSAGAELVAQARDAFLTGMGFACTVGAVVVAVAGVMTWRLLPSRPVKPPVSAGVDTEPATADSPGLHPAVEG